MEDNLNCEECGLSKTAQSVCMKGEGPSKAQVMIIGESPGISDDEMGRPFQGRLGKLLDKLLYNYGLPREEIYLTYAVKCRPPQNRTPKKGEVNACNQYLLQEIEAISPEFILVLGNTAAKSVFPEISKLKMKEVRGKFMDREEVKIYATYNPSVSFAKASRYAPIMETDFKRFFEVVELGEVPQENGLNLTIVNSDKELEAFLKDLATENIVAFDIETTSLSPWEGEVVSLGFGLKDRQYVIPLHHPEGWMYLYEAAQKKVCSQIEDILLGRDLIAQNGKFDTLWMLIKYGVDYEVAHDTMLLSHLLDENTGNGLKFLSELHFSAQNYDISLEAKQGEAKLEELAEYNALDVYYTHKLYLKFIKEIKEDPALYRFYLEVVIPASVYFRDIEAQGVFIDLNRLGEVETHLRDKSEKLQAELDAIKPGINWNSTKQVSNFLFRELGLNPLETTKSGAFSTSESVMQRLARDNEIPQKILDLRKANKMISTFIESWKNKAINSRLHPTFKLHGTVTGRLSCSNPNLQQIPRDPTIRSLVSAPPGWTMVEADFSQVELRVAAILSGDKEMQRAFLKGEDIHTKTAIMVSGINPEGMDKQKLKEWRKKAKAVNFGFLYGMGVKKFQEYARDKYGLALTLSECQNTRDKFFKAYSGLEKWYARQHRVAKMNEGVRSLSGRIRHLPDIHSEDRQLQSQAERQSVNAVVQGFASDLTIMSVIGIMDEFDELTVNIVGTVHDAILMEVRNEYLDEVLPHIKSIMENPPILKKLNISLPIPIEADISVGNWGVGVSPSK